MKEGTRVGFCADCQGGYVCAYCCEVCEETCGSAFFMLDFDCGGEGKDRGSGEQEGEDCFEEKHFGGWGADEFEGLRAEIG